MANYKSVLKEQDKWISTECPLFPIDTWKGRAGGLRKDMPQHWMQCTRDFCVSRVAALWKGKTS